MSSARAYTRIQAGSSPSVAQVAGASRLATDGIALFVSIGLITTISSRLHEITTASAIFRPALSLSVIAALILFPRVPNSRLTEVWKNPRFQSLFRYFAWMMLMVPFAVWRGGAFETITGGFLPVFILFAAVLLVSPREEHLDSLQKAFVLASAAHILLLKVFFPRGRLSGLASLDPNDLAALAAMAVPLAIGLAQRSRTFQQRLLFIGATLVLIAGVIWTSSRGGTLALAAGLLAFIALLPRQRRGSILFVLIISLPLLWVTAPADYKQRIIDLANVEEDYNTTDFFGRKQIWKRARIYIARNPITGVGVRGFETYDGMYMKEIGRTGKWSAPHNAYVQATAELGIPGGILYVVLLLGAARAAWGMARAKGKGFLSTARPEYFSSLGAFAVGAYFLSHAYSVQLFTLIALIAFAEMVSRRGSSGPPTLQAVPQNASTRSRRGTRGWRSARSAMFNMPVNSRPGPRSADTEG